jgi:hypothetical protein
VSRTPTPHGADPTGQREREGLRRRALVAAWGPRLLGVLAMLVVVVLVGVAVTYNGARQRALSTSCETWEPVDLPIERFIDLKQRKQAYQARADEPDECLWVAADEATALLRDQLQQAVYLTIDGDVVTAILTIPTDGGCWNVHFRGRLSVDERVATAVPEQLTVGDLDLTGALAGRAVSVVPTSWLTGYLDPKAAKALDNTERVTIRDGRICLRLYDPWQLW